MNPGFCNYKVVISCDFSAQSMVHLAFAWPGGSVPHGDSDREAARAIAETCAATGSSGGVHFPVFAHRGPI
jgi:hypothetical protein